jgi:hypothetical protein
MNQALQWTTEKSRAAGAPLAVLKAMARRTRGGCVARGTPKDMMRETALSRSTFYWCVSSLQQLGEIETGKVNRGKSNYRIYHLHAFCRAEQKECDFCKIYDFHAGLTVSSGNLLTRFLQPVSRVSSDPIIGCPVEKNVQWKSKAQGILFPAALTEAEAREVCEVCGGTGIKMVRYPNRDGETVQGGAICTHALARIVGKWCLAASPLHEAFMQVQLRGTSAAPKIALPLFKSGAGEGS